MTPRLATVLCSRRLTSGARCESAARSGTDRCGLHRRSAIPSERWRCTHTWPDGERCEARLSTYRTAPCGDFCQQHRISCSGGGLTCAGATSFADRLCRACRLGLARAERAATTLPPMPRRERWQRSLGAAPRCTEFSAETGKPCSGHAVPGGPRCPQHRELPADADRCTHTWPGGARCPRRRLATGTGRFCREHYEKTGRIGRPRTWVQGSHGPCTVCGATTRALGDYGRLCPEHHPRCAAVTGAGRRCTRSGTQRTAVGPRCRGRHAAQAATEAVAPVRVPAPASRQPRCALPCGAHGRPCRLRRVRGAGTCHRHRDLPAEADRCCHRYPSGDRCPARHRHAAGHGSSLFCAPHSGGRTCRTCGAATARPDAVCTGCAPRCLMPAAYRGSRCTHPVVPGQRVCAAHRDAVERARTDGRAHCVHDYGGGLTCPNVLTGRWRQVCAHHALPCRGPGTPHLTGMPDGLCRKHRPRCAVCPLPNADGRLCWRHAALATTGRCTLLSPDGTACANPAVVEHPGDGPVCAFHAVRLPPEHARCTHRHPGGPRCARSRTRRHRYCPVHAPAYSRPCGWLTPTGTPCGKPTVPRAGHADPTCEVHLLVPADAERCTRVLHDGDRLQCCPARRWRSEATCLRHLPRASCAVVTPTGYRCRRGHLVRAGTAGCRQHQDLPADADRCAARVAAGDRCPAARNFRTAYCTRHAPLAPDCPAANSRGLRCGHKTPWDERSRTWHDTCDAHAAWTPGSVTDADPDWAYRRFFLRHHTDLIALLSAPTVGTTCQSVGTGSNKRSSAARKEDAVPGTSGAAEDARDDGFVLDWDPYDLTGAADLYRFLREDPAETEESAREAAVNAAHVLAPSTCTTYTAALRPYLDACRAAGMPAVPADERTLLRFITDMGRSGHFRTGEPLSVSTVAKFRNALTRLHAQRGEVNPFDRYPRAKVLLDGYARRYATPTVEAHAIRAVELEDLLLATSAEAFPDARDQVILTVLTDPEVLVNGEPADGGLPHIAATRLRWADIDFGADATSDATLVIRRARVAGADVFTVPNRCRGLGPVDTPEGLLGAQRLCGVTALALLDDLRRMRGLPDSTPVLVARTGGGMTAKAIRKVITKAATRRGMPYAATYGADDRLTLLDALAEPSLLRLRDAAIMAAMWWASLRRSEAAGLTVGAVAEETRKRGMIVVLGWDKQGNPGTFTPVGHLVNRDGTRHLIDLQTTLMRWLTAYEAWMQVAHGRGLREDDPLFPNLQDRAKPTALSAVSIGTVIHRYAAAAGITAELGERISSHGFRRGFAQEASAKGVSAQEIARLQRRKSVQSVLTYTGRPSDPFESSLSFLVEGLDDDSFDTAAVHAALADRTRRNRRR